MLSCRHCCIGHNSRQYPDTTTPSPQEEDLGDSDDSISDLMPGVELVSDGVREVVDDV